MKKYIYVQGIKTRLKVRKKKLKEQVKNCQSEISEIEKELKK